MNSFDRVAQFIEEAKINLTLSVNFSDNLWTCALTDEEGDTFLATNDRTVEQAMSRLCAKLEDEEI